MIIASFLLGIGFFTLMMIESSMLWVFDSWVSSFPFMIAAGLLVMQRVGIPEGVAWFLVLAVVREDIVAVTLAIAGPLLMIKVFNSRSLYALLGVGLLAHAIGIVVLWGIHTTVHALLYAEWSVSYRMLWRQEALLIPTVYFGSSVLKWFERTVASRIAIKS